MASTIGRRAFMSLLSGATAWPFATRAQERRSRVLYVTHAAGYRHDALPVSRAVLKQIGEESGAFDATATDGMSEFTTATLRHYDAVMFFTTGELPMSDAHKAALLEFVRSGGGFLG